MTAGRLALHRNLPLTPVAPRCVPQERGVGDASLGRQLDILVHETLHTLGVTGWMIPRYVDAAGVPLGESRTLWSDESGRKWLVTPRMRQSAREHFGCDTMPGMPLEDDGGAGTAVSHFEMATVGNELMSGSSEGDRMLLSVFSMSQMEDTGWYAPDWSQARKMSHGRGGGCEWVYAQCHGGLVNCTPDQTNTLVPSDDHHKYGSCQPMQLESECMDVVVTEQGSCYDAFNNTGACSARGRLPRSLPRKRFCIILPDAQPNARLSGLR